MVRFALTIYLCSLGRAWKTRGDPHAGDLVEHEEIARKLSVCSGGLWIKKADREQLRWYLHEDDELFSTYKRLRNVLNEMNKELIRHLTRNSMQESARKLGLARGKTLVFSNPHEAAVLFDYCLYNSRSGGKTVIERYAEKTRPAPESDETTVLHAMLDSFFSVFQVREVHKGRGVLLIEFFGKYEVFLMDIELGDTAVPDMPLAGRVLPFGDFYISSGALLPLHEEPVSEAVIPIMERWLLNRLDMTHSKLSPGLEASFSAQLIRAALRAGALETVRYSDMRE